MTHSQSKELPEKLYDDEMYTKAPMPFAGRGHVGKVFQIIIIMMYTKSSNTDNLIKFMADKTLYCCRTPSRAVGLESRKFRSKHFVI